MTCLAYKNGILASDSQVVSRTWSMPGSFEKIGRKEVDGEVYLYGAIGETAYCFKFMRWVQSELFDAWVRDRDSMTPELEPDGKEENCRGFVIMPDDSCMNFEGNYPPYPINGDYYAFGSGDATALGALGFTNAIQAVEQAIKHDVLSNGPVQFVKR